MGASIYDENMARGRGYQKCTFEDKGGRGVSELCTYAFSRHPLWNMDVVCLHNMKSKFFEINTCHKPTLKWVQIANTKKINSWIRGEYIKSVCLLLGGWSIGYICRQRGDGVSKMSKNVCTSFMDAPFTKKIFWVVTLFTPFWLFFCMKKFEMFFPYRKFQISCQYHENMVARAFKPEAASM